MTRPLGSLESHCRQAVGGGAELGEGRSGAEAQFGEKGELRTMGGWGAWASAQAQVRPPLSRCCQGAVPDPGCPWLRKVNIWTQLPDFLVPLWCPPWDFAHFVFCFSQG